LKDVPGRFVPESGGRPAAQLLVDDRDEFVSRGDVAFAPCVKQSRHVVIGTVQAAFARFRHLDVPVPGANVLGLNPSCFAGRTPDFGGE
jgi:hypothetical protein